MKILITGGAGFVGSHLVRRFLEAGADVTVYDNMSRIESHGLGREIRNDYWTSGKRRAMIVQGDVRNSESVTSASRDADVILHTAGQVAVTSSLTSPREDFEINCLGTINVLEAARRRDAFVVFCSTNKVYGDNVNKIPVIEKERRYEFGEGFEDGVPESFPVDLCGHSPYGCSKLAADLYVQDYGKTYGIGTCVFRMSCTYGEGQLGSEDQGWVAWFAIAAVNRLTPTIYGDGKQVRDVLYVGDLVNAFYGAVENRDRLKGEVFNMGGGPKNTLSLLELVRMLEGGLGIEIAPEYSKWRPSDQKVYISDIQKAQRVLGWKPLVGPQQGVSRLIDWVSRSGVELIPRAAR